MATQWIEGECEECGATIEYCLDVKSGERGGRCPECDWEFDETLVVDQNGQAILDENGKFVYKVTKRKAFSEHFVCSHCEHAVYEYPFQCALCRQHLCSKCATGGPGNLLFCPDCVEMAWKKVELQPSLPPFM